MIILPKSDISPSEITPEHIFKDRRTFIKQAGFGLAAATIINQKAFGGTISSGTTEGDGRLLGRANQKAVISQQKDPVAIKNYKKTAYGQGEKLTKENDVIGYNNFYEFGTGKEDPAEFSDSLQTDPWSVSIEGAVKQNKTITMEDILKRFPLEERIYRMRCVEGWSMVIPWVGLSLADFIKWAQPTGNAKYVEFVSFADRQQMPGTNLPILDWPYTEALRLDEAMNDLTILAVGLYGKTLPNQNGAPIRLVVPWKYGFKGGKSIVKIRFTEKMPRTTWMKAGPREYGFYANVNPNVDHPRWSQSSEKPIGGGLFGGRIKTKMFNGYTDQVGQLYAGLDLAKNF